MSKRIEDLKDIAKTAPTVPGVYLMKNRQDKVIYVGKAKNIRNRVRSYFIDSKDQQPKTRLLVSYIYELEFLTTTTEAEAFLLEASLIKKYKPRFNIRLKDDKSYPYLRVSLADDYPRLYLSRKLQGDPREYFGPFTSSLSVRETIKFLNRSFQIRDCKDHDFKNRKRPCMTHQIGRCTAPCVKLISKEDYAKDISMAVRFLNGKNKSILSSIEKKMKIAAKEERFEEAARLRDSATALTHILEKQNVIHAKSTQDIDVIGFYGEIAGIVIECVHIRKGIMIGHQHHFFSSANIVEGDEDIRDTLTAFVLQYYHDNLIPDEILMPVEMGRKLNLLMADLFKERGKNKISIRLPNDEGGKKLLHMAMQNAKENYQSHIRKVDEYKKALEDIKMKLKLKKIPERIECYDISHFQGDQTVASQVVFENGMAAKENYRLYKINSVQGIDDFLSMKEVLSRRLQHEEYQEPDLIVVDGGKGQLKLAMEALKECGREDIPICSLAKARTESSFQKEEVKYSSERVFIPNRDNPVIFYPNTKAFQILTGIRDEAHRFAITYHRRLRDQKFISSELDEITGLGEKRKALLLSHFGSVSKIKNASIQEISSLKGISKKLAEKILKELSK